jgi:hypothetical protein
MPSTGIEQIQATYLLLDQNFDKLYGACQTDDLKAALQSAYAPARDAFNAVINKTLADSDPLVASDIAQLQQLNSAIKDSLDGLNNVASIIGDVTTAVQLASKLAPLAA